MTTTTSYERTSAGLQRSPRSGRAPAGTGRFVTLVVGPGDPLADVGPHRRAAGLRGVVRQRRRGDGRRVRPVRGEQPVLRGDRPAPRRAGGRGPHDRAAAARPSTTPPATSACDAVHHPRRARHDTAGGSGTSPRWRCCRSIAVDGRRWLVSSLLYRTFLVAGPPARGAARGVHARPRGVPQHRAGRCADADPMAGSGAVRLPGLGGEPRGLHGLSGSSSRDPRQAVQLRRRRRGRSAALARSGPRKLLIRRVAAGISRRVSTGRDLDAHILFA